MQIKKKEINQMKDQKKREGKKRCQWMPVAEREDNKRSMKNGRKEDIKKKERSEG